MLAGIVCHTSQSSSNWLINSGATNHIYPHFDRFQDYKQITTNDSFITNRWQTGDSNAYRNN